MTSLHASQHERLPQNLEGLVVITRLNCTIDEKPTSIDERSPAVLKYRTPHFRCVITVLLLPQQTILLVITLPMLMIWVLYAPYLLRGLFFLFFAHLWWFGVLGLGSWIGVLGLGFMLRGFTACGMEPFGFFGVGALYINKE